MNREIKTIGILPWVGKDQHQINFANALEEQGYKVEKIVYKKGFPLYNAKKKNIDLLVLDWVHSFYISHSILISLLKTILQFIDRLLIRNRDFSIIWNMHNLHRHDKRFIKLERYNFKKLAACVDGIRVFNEYSINKAREYFNLFPDYPIVSIPQGQYNYKIDAIKFSENNFGVSKDNFVILFFGSIREGKGLDKFIKTFKQVKDDSLKLIIAGKPIELKLRNTIRELVTNENRILLMDSFIDDDKIQELFKAADVLVLPYEYISNSGVQILAHSYSKPILANDIPAFRNTLNSDYSEFFILNDVQSLHLSLERFKKRDFNAMKIASGAELKDRNWNEVVFKFLTFAENLNTRSGSKLK